MESTKNITIALIDRHMLFLDGMRKIIDSISYLKVTAIGRSRHDAFTVIKRYKPNLLVVDANLVELESLNKVKTPDTKIILLSGNEYDENFVIKALYLGVKGFLLRSMHSELLIEALVTVFQGRFWLHPNVSHCLMNEYTKLRKKHLEVDNVIEVDRPLHIFTNREYEILELLVEGDSNLEIATKLGITEFTVKTHVRNILGKMHVNDRTNAVVSAIRNGWVRIERNNKTYLLG